MKELRSTSQTFPNYPKGLYAANVTFQQSFHSSSAIREGKINFSGKHKFYSVKVEVSVLSNRLTIACSNHYPGSLRDLEIIQRRIEVPKKSLGKKERDGNIPEGGLHFDNYPDE